MKNETREKSGFVSLLRRAFAISDDTGRDVEELFEEDAVELSEEGAKALYTKVIEVMRRGAERRGDRRTAAKLAGETEAIVGDLMKVRRAGKGARKMSVGSS